jgi:polysaccharide biosynthesis protein PslH
MKVLAVCESPPTLDPRHANGSTLISHHLLSRLSPDHRLDLAWFADRPVPPSVEVQQRAATSESIELRGLGIGVLAQAVATLPLATWRRSSAQAAGVVGRLAAGADVVYLHGLHTFGLLGACGNAPVVAHEVDPWSAHWRQRADARSVPGSLYDRLQAARAARLEAEVAARSHALLVVSPDDARRLARSTGSSSVVALPNGVRTPAPLTTEVKRSARRVVFAGTLDYPPNVAAVRTLLDEVWPRVREGVPDAELVIAGRRPTAELETSVAASRGEGVKLLADVPDLSAVLRSAAVGVFPGDLGGGTRNTVLEALAAGCPVVTSTASRRGLDDGEHLRVADGPAEMAAEVVAWLRDDERRRLAAKAAVDAAERFPTWEETTERFEALLQAAAR